MRQKSDHAVPTGQSSHALAIDNHARMTPGAVEELGAAVEELGTAEAAVVEVGAAVEAEDGNVVAAVVVGGAVGPDADVGGAVCVVGWTVVVVDGKTAGLPTSTH